MTNLSNRQFPLLRIFIDNTTPNYHMTIEEAAELDQRPFRSMLMRGWVSYHPRRGFFLTKVGRDAWHEFQNTNIIRMNPHAPLCGYFYDLFKDKGVTRKVSRPPKVARPPRQTRLPGLEPDTAPSRFN